MSLTQQLSKLKGRTALITGASSGLGADFARHLAHGGCNLVLVARREENLQQLKQELAPTGVTITLVPMDLLAEGAPEQLHKFLQEKGLAVDVLINNAGLGLYGKFLTIPWDKEQAMLELDMRVVVQLTKLFLPAMVQRGLGYVLNIASTGAYQPTPLYATYAAAKAFILSFSEALHFELKGTGVTVTVLSPGVTATEFLSVSGQTATPYQRKTRMESPEVTAIGLRAMLRGRSSVIAGWMNAFMAFTTRFSPRSTTAALAYAFMK